MAGGRGLIFMYVSTFSMEFILESFLFLEKRWKTQLNVHSNIDVCVCVWSTDNGVQIAYICWLLTFIIIRFDRSHAQPWIHSFNSHLLSSRTLHTAHRPKYQKFKFISECKCSENVCLYNYLHIANRKWVHWALGTTFMYDIKSFVS